MASPSGDIQPYGLADKADYITALIRDRHRERVHEPANLKPDKYYYPVRNTPFVPKVIVRRKRTVTPAADSTAQVHIGTYELPGDTLAAGSQQESLSPTDTLRNSSLMQSTLPSNRLLSATEIAMGVEADTLDRLQVVEREMWKAFKAEVAGENRPSARVRILEKIGELQVKQVGVAKHVVRVERAVPVEWERLRDRVITALQNHPEALAAVMSALESSDD